MALYQLNDREHATVLAALRYWQRKGLMGDPVAELDIASDGGTLDPLAADEIDALCEGLNRHSRALADFGARPDHESAGATPHEREGE